MKEDTKENSLTIFVLSRKWFSTVPTHEWIPDTDGSFRFQFKADSAKNLPPE